MKTRIIRFIECELDGNWAFTAPDSGATHSVSPNSWLEAKKRVIYSQKDDAKLTITVDSKLYEYFFNKGKVVIFDDGLLLMDADSTTRK
ncbi:MAG: hypothetical protein ABI361_03290 [Nitrososphaera sp.]|jgi:sucrose-6-phosphate hydrolase SacC (GH32 family)